MYIGSNDNRRRYVIVTTRDQLLLSSVKTSRFQLESLRCLMLPPQQTRAATLDTQSDVFTSPFIVVDPLKT